MSREALATSAQVHYAASRQLVEANPQQAIARALQGLLAIALAAELYG